MRNNLVKMGLLVLFTLLLNRVALAEKPLPLMPFEALYEVGNDMIVAAESRLSLKSSGNNQWTYRSHTKAIGLAALFNIDPINESSELEWFDGQLRSLRYRSDQNGVKDESQFDWQKKELHLSRNGNSRTLPLAAGTLDHASALLPIMQQLDDDFKSLEIAVNEKGTARILTFVNQGHESIQTPFGRYDTIKVRQSRDPGSQIGLIWFAPQLHNLPVRIEQHNKGKLVARMELIALPLSPQSPK